jgi:hypothetical protein
VFFVDSLYPKHDKSCFNAAKLESNNRFFIIRELLGCSHLSFYFFENSEVNRFTYDLFGVCRNEGGGKQIPVVDFLPIFLNHYFELDAMWTLANKRIWSLDP